MNHVLQIERRDWEVIRLRDNRLIDCINVIAHIKRQKLFWNVTSIQSDNKPNI